MATVYPLQANMTRGALTPYLHARVDTEHYQSGLEEADNVVVMRFGGVTRTPGTIFGGFAKIDNRAARFLPFRFDETQVYAIEAGHEYFRFWVAGDSGAEQVFDGPDPYEVATPYQEADLSTIKVKQSADKVYITADGYPPHELIRNGETDWVLQPYIAEDGPYGDVNTTGTTITFSATGAVHPFMISDNTPSGVASADIAGVPIADPFKAFDGNKNTYVQYGDPNGNLDYLFDSPTERVCDAYWIRSIGFGDPVAPTVWDFQGTPDNGATWVTLDTRQGEDNWARGEVRFFEFTNETAYTGYRLRVGGSEDTGNMYIAEVGMHESAVTQDPITFTLSDTDGFNDGVGLLATDVGRAIRIYGTDGRWRWIRVLSRVSATEGTCNIYGHALPDLEPLVNWRLGSWSDTSGYPSAIALHEDRLTFGGAPADPIAGHSSVSSDYDNFRQSIPLLDDDAVRFRLTGGDLNRINWMASGRDLVIGTPSALRAVGRNDQGKAFSPSNVRQRYETEVSTSRADPVLIENMLLFLDGYESRLYEAAYTYEVEGYLAKEITAVNEHLFAGGVKEVIYQSHPHRILWVRREDGKLVAATYDRDQKVFGCTLVDFGGVVESVMALPGTAKTDVFMVVRRTVNGVVKRCVETLAEFFRTAFTRQGVPVYAASAAIYDGAATNVITGLTHLEGAEVGVWGDEIDWGTFTVTGGQVTLPNGVEVEQAVIGRRMPWQVRTLRLAQIGNRDGSGLGRKVNIAEAFIDLYETPALEVETINGAYPFHFADIELDPYEPRPYRTGMFSMNVDDSWRNNGQITIKGDSMYPATIRAIQLGIEGEP